MWDQTRNRKPKANRHDLSLPPLSPSLCSPNSLDANLHTMSFAPWLLPPSPLPLSRKRHSVARVEYVNESNRQITSGFVPSSPVPPLPTECCRQVEVMNAMCTGKLGKTEKMYGRIRVREERTTTKNHIENAWIRFFPLSCNDLPLFSFPQIKFREKTLKFVPRKRFFSSSSTSRVSCGYAFGFGGAQNGNFSYFFARMYCALFVAYIYS